MQKLATLKRKTDDSRTHDQEVQTKGTKLQRTRPTKGWPTSTTKQEKTVMRPASTETLIAKGKETSTQVNSAGNKTGGKTKESTIKPKDPQLFTKPTAPKKTKTPPTSYMTTQIHENDTGDTEDQTANERAVVEVEAEVEAEGDAVEDIQVVPKSQLGEGQGGEEDLKTLIFVDGRISYWTSLEK